MQWLTFGLLTVLSAGAAVYAATDVLPSSATDAQSESTAIPPPAEPAPTIVEPAKPKVEKPKPVEKPRPVEKPKPAEPPRAVAPEKPKPAIAEPPKAAASSLSPEPPSTHEQSAPANEIAPAQPPAVAGEPAGRSLACWIFSFAMLVVGFAAGFVARHLWTRRQLGGMTVRIGTWRGIP